MSGQFPELWLVTWQYTGLLLAEKYFQFILCYHLCLMWSVWKNGLNRRIRGHFCRNVIPRLVTHQNRNDDNFMTEHALQWVTLNTLRANHDDSLWVGRGGSEVCSPTALPVISELLRPLPGLQLHHDPVLGLTQLWCHLSIRLMGWKLLVIVLCLRFFPYDDNS